MKDLNTIIADNAVEAGLITEDEKLEFIGTLNAIDDIDWDIHSETVDPYTDAIDETIISQPYYQELEELCNLDEFVTRTTDATPQEYHRNWTKMKAFIERMNSVENKVYKELLLHHIGKENRILGRDLCEMFNIKNTSVLREIISNIRINPIYKYLIGAIPNENGGYWIVTNEGDKRKAIISMEGRAIKMLEVAKQMGIKKTLGENND